MVIPILGGNDYMCNMLEVPNATHDTESIHISCVQIGQPIQYKGVGSFCHNYLRSKLFNICYISQHQGVLWVHCNAKCKSPSVVFWKI